eukprot:TRINITY_DN9204_c0_g1_i1.p2 TRINITY_DN9204_c0_g1~~TRINITY_DN9204_c0_g1_i1.p2  ORF type:complete len:126 (+),score=28.39 TRINITY_DN9204_c0_g1_i1:210-587(+)
MSTPQLGELFMALGPFDFEIMLQEIGISKLYQRQQIVNCLQAYKSPGKPTILGRLNNTQMPKPMPTSPGSPKKPVLIEPVKPAPIGLAGTETEEEEEEEEEEDILALHEAELRASREWEQQYANR